LNWNKNEKKYCAILTTLILSGNSYAFQGACPEVKDLHYDTSKKSWVVAANSYNTSWAEDTIHKDSGGRRIQGSEKDGTLYFSGASAKLEEKSKYLQYVIYCTYVQKLGHAHGWQGLNIFARSETVPYVMLSLQNFYAFSLTSPNSWIQQPNNQALSLCGARRDSSTNYRLGPSDCKFVYYSNEHDKMPDTDTVKYPEGEEKQGSSADNTGKMPNTNTEKRPRDEETTSSADAEKRPKGEETASKPNE
jgi:hypothetical protein